jgi:outer membrane immunogenic protein
MIVKRRLLRGAALPALLASPAIAADMPVKAPPPPPPTIFSWTGFYVGLNAGGTWARSNADTTVNCNVPFGSPPLPYFCEQGIAVANGAAVSAAGSGTITASGFTGGIQAGYNWQGPNLIYGLETDFDAFHLRGSRQGTGTYPEGFGIVIAGSPFAINSSFNTDWLYTLRGRIGVPVSSNLMAYATGGLALTRLGVSNSFSDNISPPRAFNAAGTANGSETKAGWVVGGGLEYALVNNWSIKAEYLFMDFGKVTATGTIFNPSSPGYAQGISTSSDLTAQVARVGVNRRF